MMCDTGSGKPEEMAAVIALAALSAAATAVLTAAGMLAVDTCSAAAAAVCVRSATAVAAAAAAAAGHCAVFVSHSAIWWYWSLLRVGSVSVGVDTISRALY